MAITSAILLVTILVNLALVVFIYFSTKITKSILFYLLLLGSVILWSAPLFVYYYTNIPETALLLSKVAYSAAALSALFFLYFCLYFPENKPFFPKWISFILWIPFSLFVYLIHADYIITGFKVFNKERIISFGSLYPLYFFYISFYFFLGFWLLVAKYKKAKRNLKRQIKYILVGFFVTVFFATVFNLLLPTVGNFRYYQIGPMWTLAMVIFIAYAITKHHLFNIRVIATELLVGLVSLVLFIELLLAQGASKVIFKGLILIAFIYLGWTLIKSVLKEIKRREEMEEMADNLREAYDELKRIDEAKSEFVAMASHQLRTPITIVKGLSSMILEGEYGEVPEDARPPLKDIFESNERLVNVVNDLLNISKADLGRLELELEETDMGEVVESVVNELSRRAEKKGLKIKWRKPKDFDKLRVDPVKMRQVVFNLLDNAIRYTNEGSITITLESVDSKVRLKVQDTGEGMSEEELTKIFARFIRGEAGVNRFVEGTGLGLYLNKKYVELHGGEIWAKSKGKGKGSTFYVEIPKKAEKKTENGGEDKNN